MHLAVGFGVERRLGEHDRMLARRNAELVEEPAVWQALAQPRDRGHMAQPVDIGPKPCTSYAP
jgi:hypothetical protein